jgi:hypothetical protein
LDSNKLIIQKAVGEYLLRIDLPKSKNDEAGNLFRAARFFCVKRNRIQTKTQQKTQQRQYFSA